MLRLLYYDYLIFDELMIITMKTVVLIISMQNKSIIYQKFLLIFQKLIKNLKFNPLPLPFFLSKFYIYQNCTFQKNTQFYNINENNDNNKNKN